MCSNLLKALAREQVASVEDAVFRQNGELKGEELF